LGLEHIESHTGRILKQHIAPAGEAGSSTFVFDEGNVLYSKLRPYLNKVVHPAEPGIATTELVPLRPKRELIDPEYLTYFLRSPHFVTFASSCVAGVKMPRVIMDKLWAYPVPLPPPSEQARIVSLLKQADVIRRKRAAAAAKSDRILPALFLKMFGDPSKNPKGFDVLLLGDPRMGMLDRGRSRHRPRNDPALLGGPYPLIQTGDVARSDGRIRSYSQTYSEGGLAQSKLWPAGTLCITIAANIAETGVLEFDACFPDSVVGFVPGELTTTEYVQFFLRFLQPVLERNAPQAAQKNINLEVLRELPCPVAPRALQEAFAASVQLHYATRRSQLQVRERLDSLFGNMLRRAFRGLLTERWRERNLPLLVREAEQQAHYLAASGTEAA
jgi:type I restriction enzyme S subunit